MALGDAGLGEVRRQLPSKGQYHHCRIKMADHSFP